MCGLTNCTHQNNISKLETPHKMDNSNQPLPVDIEAKPLQPLPVVVSSKKSVSFYGTVQVMLIPCIQEYRDAKLFDSLWWEVKDFRAFQMDLSVAFKRFLHRTPCPDLKQALKLFILDELEGGGESNENCFPVKGLKRSLEPPNLLMTSELMPLGKRAKV